MNQYQDYIHLSRYARWLEAQGRRETWNETVQRYFDFFEQHLVEKKYITTNEYNQIRGKLEQSVVDGLNMPSMRALATAGEALKRDNVAGYNCAFVIANYKECFNETLYILLCGTGVGFSVERQFICDLPVVGKIDNSVTPKIIVEDSKEGWATAFKELINYLYDGYIPKFDISKVRPAGSRLKTFGGRASGAKPLVDLFNFTIELFKQSSGRKLKSIEIHDLFCKIAEIVVVGGVRRSALISLSNLSDRRMAEAKQGNWWIDNPHRSLSNNSVAYTEKPEIGIFMEEWLSLYDSKSGERGIFNREACTNKAKEAGRKVEDFFFGCNPCSEIILRPKQFCNLTEVIVRYNDTIESLKEKIKNATILGTWQATLTYFPYLSKDWQNNCEEERLLGVSLTGVMDNPILNNNHTNLPKVLNELKQVALDTNKKWSTKLGINHSVSVTCNKPSGTVSQLQDCSSGLHPRHSKYYIRTVRADIKDPLSKFMIDKGFVHDVDSMNPSNYVFSFPIKSPDNATCRKDITAIQHLELWLTYYKYWCQHKPSVTISVQDHEWIEVGAWCYEHFDDLSGVSFLPYSEHNYTQAPYQEIEEKEYLDLKAITPNVNWNEFRELSDNTISSQEMACTGNSCEL